MMDNGLILHRAANENLMWNTHILNRLKKKKNIKKQYYCDQIM